jgi:hypothetical protein
LFTNSWKYSAREDDLKGQVARKGPFINEARLKRLKFAREHVTRGSEFWNRVLWTAESKFNIFGSGGRNLVLRRKNEELKMKNLHPTIKHSGGSFMVWGCMATSDVGNRKFITGIMNQYAY